MARSHGLIRFRSPLLTESRLISFPPGTEMFQFPGLAPNGLCIQPPVTVSGCPVPPGCPIRRSPDQSVFGRSPELIAAYNVLHRLCTPRHPPCTLLSLTTFTKPCGQTAGALQLHYPHPRFDCQRSSARPAAAEPPQAAGLRPSTDIEDRKLTACSPACQVEPTGIEPATSALQTRRSPD